jgi:hypothetical protein
MEKYLKGALVSNSASLGFNWVYNMPYLEKLSSEQSLLFQKEDPNQYKRAGKSYLAYPYAEVGSVSFQGEISKWLYQSLLENKDFSKEAYLDLVFDKVQPAGSYIGYAESYARKLVMNRYLAQFKMPEHQLPQNDDQIVGFIPYLVCKELNLGNIKAFELAQAFTNIEDYLTFYQMFDSIFDLIQSTDLNQAILQSIDLAPPSYQENLKLAISMSDTKAFIINHSGTACHIPHAIPLIIHILYHSKNFEEAVYLNTKIGGASSDRGMLIGAIMSQVSDIPKSWIEKMTF